MTATPVRKILVGITALHSLILGGAMLLAPDFVLEASGWNDIQPTFFVEQSGIFLVVLGVAYAAGIRHRRFAWFLVATKVAAVAFLLSEFFVRAVPPSIVLAAVLDGLMGLGVGAAMTRESLCIRRDRTGDKESSDEQAVGAR